MDTVTKETNLYIEQEGKGDTRTALIKALAQKDHAESHLSFMNKRYNSLFDYFNKLYPDEVREWLNTSVKG